MTCHVNTDGYQIFSSDKIIRYLKEKSLMENLIKNPVI